MKKIVITTVALTLLTAVSYAAPSWETIGDVATNAALTAEWAEFTDFVPDLDEDGYLYIKLWDPTGLPWPGNAGQNSGGTWNMYRLNGSSDLSLSPTAWEHVIRYHSNNQAGEKLATVKKGNAFLGANFGNIPSTPGTGGNGAGWDWSSFSYWRTNAAGDAVVTGGVGTTLDYASYHPNNSHPLTDIQYGAFTEFTSIIDYKVLAASGNSANNQMVIRGVYGTTYDQIAGQDNDSVWKKWSRVAVLGTDAYFWKGPSSSTTADGIWRVQNYTAADAGVNLTNADNFIPVTTMGAGADTWDVNEHNPCGIVALSATENYLGKDLLVVSMNQDGGKILAFDIANPTAGPVTLFAVTDLMPAGQASDRLQLGKVGKYLFVMDGSSDADRTLRRLNMIPEPTMFVMLLGASLLFFRKK